MTKQLIHYYNMEKYIHLGSVLQKIKKIEKDTDDRDLDSWYKDGKLNVLIELRKFLECEK